MKKSLTSVLIGLAALAFPLALFAQSDGSTEPPPVETPPQETPVESSPVVTPPPVETPVAEPAAPAPASAPTPTTTTTSDPAPRPAPAQMAVMPALVPAAAAQGATTTEPAPEPVALEQIQELVETVADEAPSAFQPWLAALAGALAAVIATLGIQAALKKARQKGTKPCPYCDGTGHEHAHETCKDCEGSGTVEEEHEATVECPQCEGEGEEPCEACEGEGEIDGQPCAACEGSGVETDDEGETLECRLCRGEGETSVTLKRDATCPACKGGIMK